MREKAIFFGKKSALTGVISEPQALSAPTLPIVIILNSGLLHKVGPFRLSVDLARKLQSLDYIVLRMDISGIGDSKMRLLPDSSPASIADLSETMDYLSGAYHQNKFVLMGLCSGADNSHRVATLDSRVIGTVNLDGYCPKNYKYSIKYYSNRFSSPRFIKEKILELFKKRCCTEHKGVFDQKSEALARAFPSKEKLCLDFSSLLERSVRMLYVFTRGVEYYCNYQNQLKDVLAPLDTKDLLQVQMYPYFDHTFSRGKARKQVIDRITAWLQESFC